MKAPVYSDRTARLPPLRGRRGLGVLGLELVQGFGNLGRINVFLVFQEPLPDLLPKVAEAAMPACQLGALVRSDFVFEAPGCFDFKNSQCLGLKSSGWAAKGRACLA